MHPSVFFKLFPPPKFMTMKHAGLDISDDAIRCLEFTSLGKELRIQKYGQIVLPAGLIDGGEIKDEKKFGEILKEFDLKYKLSYVKVSVPEEKAFLFETEVPKADVRVIDQNIEFKLEENVPLSAADAVFYFDLLPHEIGKPMRASVSVVPKNYIERLMSLLREAGITPVAFEVVPKAIARAAVTSAIGDTALIVHAMGKKTGLYIVSGGIVLFTSTMGWGSTLADDSSISTLCAEIEKVYSYWVTRDMASPISRVILAGSSMPALEDHIRGGITSITVPIAVADAWKNIFNLDRYIPPIPKADSLDFAVAAGLAMNS